MSSNPIIDGPEKYTVGGLAQKLIPEGHAVYLKARARPGSPYGYLDGWFTGYRNQISRVVADEGNAMGGRCQTFPDPIAGIRHIHAAFLEKVMPWVEMPEKDIAAAALNIEIQQSIRQAQAQDTPAARQAGARAFLDRLTGRGIELDVRGGKHLTACPATKLTDDDRKHLGVYKAELIEEVGRNVYVVP